MTANKKSSKNNSATANKAANGSAPKSASKGTPKNTSIDTNLIERPYYTNTISRFLDTPEIKVLIGVRRCGKSSLLTLLSSSLLKSGVPKKNIIYIKLDGYDIPLNPTDEWLNSEIHAKLNATKTSMPTYVFLDEVQEVPGWENVVRKLNTRPNTSIFITGSNSRVLSGDLSTFLTGRYIEIPIYPLNFKEYKTFASKSRWEAGNTEKLFDNYMTYGAMPGLFHYKQDDEDAFQKLLSSITDTVILKDVIERHAIKDAELLKRVIKFVFSTSGNLLSTKKIVDTLVSAGKKSSQETIDNYIHALISSKILTPCMQAGISGKEILRAKQKYYVVDTGLRNMSIGFNRTKDLGFQFEGLIHNELASRGWHVGTLRNRNDEEVDFLATRKDKKMYIQVSLSVLDEKTFAREIRPLTSINDSFPKYVVVKDHNRLGTTEQGIHIVDVLDFLDHLG